VPGLITRPAKPIKCILNSAVRPELDPRSGRNGPRHGPSPGVGKGISGSHFPPREPQAVPPTTEAVAFSDT